MSDTLPKKAVSPKKQPEPKRKTTVAKKDTLQMKPAMDTMDHSMHMMHTMPSHGYSKNLPMSRNGSGTGWSPDASPMYMWMKSTKKN